MASITKVIFLVFFLGALSKVRAQGRCRVSSLKINQVATGAEVENKPQWNVTILNTCFCAQKAISLECCGFQTVEKLNSSVISVSGDLCYVVHDIVLFENDSVSFTYAWDKQYPFKPHESYIHCP